MEKLWTTSEAAACLGVAEADVAQLVRQGKLTGYKLGGQFLRFRPEQVLALKGNVAFRPASATSPARRDGSWMHQIRDFIYFYDFYFISATCLAGLIIYLIAS